MKIINNFDLKEKHIKNSKLVENRIKLLKLLPKNSICAEIGVKYGNYSNEILTKTNPKELHLIEINEEFVKGLKKRFHDEILKKTIKIHKGYSYEILQKFPDNFFDWVYIDASHNYKNVKKDLKVAKLKIKMKGLIALHDYILYSHVENQEYGVVQAVNEFCNKYNYEIVYFTLEKHMYNTLVLRKLD